MGKFSEFMVRAESSEEQCQATTNRGQCLLRKMPDSEYCAAHGGNRAYTTARKEKKRLYQIKQYKQRMESLADNEAATSYREEIAVLRIMLESKLNKCEDDQQLMLYAPFISDLIVKITKAVDSAARLEQLLGKVLSEDQAMGLISEIMTVITNSINDPAIFEEIANGIEACVDSAFKGDLE